MAIIDDKNSGVPTGAGKDPLEELDRELERLRAQMDGADSSAPQEIAVPGDDPAEDAAADDSRGGAAPTEISRPGKPAPAAPAAPRYAQEPPSKSPKIPLVLAALLVALVGVAAGVTAYLFGKANQTPADEPQEPPAVTVVDPELGTLEITPPEDASVNTYDAANLVRDDNGYYAYYVNGEKVSEAGADLSEFQGEIDFGAVKASGVDFVMLRIGGRTYGSGSLYADGKFDEYYQQATEAGLKVGAYFFSQAISRDEGVEEAQYILDLLGGRELSYPIAIDWEIIDDDDARTDNIDPAALTALAAAFCDTVEAAGYRSAVYASTSLILQSYDFNVMKNYDFWLADYRNMPEQDEMYYRYTIWQYSDSGSVPGIEGDVDLNLCFLSR